MHVYRLTSKGRTIFCLHFMTFIFLKVIWGENPELNPHRAALSF